MHCQRVPSLEARPYGNLILRAMDYYRRSNRRWTAANAARRETAAETRRVGVSFDSLRRQLSGLTANVNLLVLMRVPWLVGFGKRRRIPGFRPPRPTFAS